MARLDGAGDPLGAVERGLYVKPQTEIAEQVLARLELRPAATQLIVGGIGAGKTTQLHVARKRLVERDPDVLAIYLDVSVHQDLARIQPGSLMALCGLMIAEQSGSARAKEFHQSFEAWAHGNYWDNWELYQRDEIGSDYTFVPGVVTPPKPRLEKELQQRRDELRDFLAEEYPDRPIALFIDSLDRLADMPAFHTLVTQDITALSALGVGVVVVGPLRSLYGLERAITDHFDHFYRQSAMDLADDPANLAFLVDVLQKRADPAILPEPQCAELARLSGGVLRDLIRLTHQAVEEAYLAGADQVESPHVQRAADAFGRSLMMGLSAQELDKLREIQRSSTFVETEERDLALLVTRRVLDYQDRAIVRYRVHPTLETLLRQSAE